MVTIIHRYKLNHDPHNWMWTELWQSYKGTKWAVTLIPRYKLSCDPHTQVLTKLQPSFPGRNWTMTFIYCTGTSWTMTLIPRHEVNCDPYTEIITEPWPLCTSTNWTMTPTPRSEMSRDPHTQVQTKLWPSYPGRNRTLTLVQMYKLNFDPHTQVETEQWSSKPKLWPSYRGPNWTMILTPRNELNCGLAIKLHHKSRWSSSNKQQKINLCSFVFSIRLMMSFVPFFLTTSGIWVWDADLCSTPQPHLKRFGPPESLPSFQSSVLWGGQEGAQREWCFMMGGETVEQWPIKTWSWVKQCTMKTLT